MNHFQIVGLALIGSAILLCTGYGIARWVHYQIRRAELRAWKREWNEVTSSQVSYVRPMWIQDTAYQPDPWAASEAYYDDYSNTSQIKAVQTGPNPTLVLKLEPETVRYAPPLELEPDEDIAPPEYDSELDTRMYMARQAEDLKEYLRELRQR